MKKNKFKILISIVVFLFLFVWINNSSLFVRVKNKKPLLVAHRGMAQTFDLKDVKWNTNTAAIIHVPEHSFIENTILSMDEAFKNGADVVEFDIRVTKDKKLAVFHDFTLDFRTNTKGDVSDYTMAELKKLDIGYGYTYDEGKTYPFRGNFIGMMPEIDEVFKIFPDKEFLIHIKDSGVEIGKLLCDYLSLMDSKQRGCLSIYGDEDAINYIKAVYPENKVLTKSLVKKAFIDYELIGWTGYVPKSMRNIQMHMPLKYAKYLWGWPVRFQKRVESVNSRFVLVNGYDGFTSGFDTEDDFATLPEHYSGYIWTNKIEKIAPRIKEIFN